MKTYTLNEFAEHLFKIRFSQEFAALEGLKVVAKKIERTAKSEFGHYQPEVGPFQDWAPLAESTIDDRIRQGYTPDDPLLRSGALRESISNHVEPFSATIGSTSDVMVYQEFGTSKIPPRPVLGPAVIRNEKQIEAILGTAIVSGIMGETSIHPALGYNREIIKDTDV